MPDVARSLGIASIAIVPYYYFPEEVGRDYERELRALDCQAYSWVGFHHEGSGVDPEEFTRQYRRYLAGLGEVYDYPYLKLSEAEYRTWFSDSRTPVGPHQGCTNVEKLIDIQPDGTANFCVDFVDYAIGSVRDSSIESLWNGERAERFRRLRRERPLAVCYRCGAKYMSEIVS
jgi:MoaA/NifB/PqqE/SkfB family radical SAM enzyme